MDKFRQYWKYFHKTICGFALKYKNNNDLTIYETKTAKKLVWFRSISTAGIFVLYLIVMIVRLSNIWMGIFILVAYYFLSLIIFLVLFNKEKLSDELFKKIKEY